MLGYRHGEFLRQRQATLMADDPRILQTRDGSTAAGVEVSCMEFSLGDLIIMVGHDLSQLLQ